MADMTREEIHAVLIVLSGKAKQKGSLMESIGIRRRTIEYHKNVEFQRIAVYEAELRDFEAQSAALEKEILGLCQGLADAKVSVSEMLALLRAQIRIEEQQS